MSISASRQLLSRLLKNNNKRCVKYLVNTRFKSDQTDKNISDSKEPRKIATAVLKKFSEPLEIVNVDPPSLKSKEVLIDVNYCALNGVDVLMCENLYGQEPSLPFVPGYEVSGNLVEVSEDAKKAGYNVGDKVIALNKERFGGLAEQCVAEIDDVWKIPTAIKSIDAACLLENYMTALIGLEKYGSISEEDMILINVGLGGIGLSAVDIAANVYQAKVIGVGFSEDRADHIRERGAFHAFTYKEKTLFKEIEEITHDRGIEGIFEGQPGEHFKKVLKAFMNIYKTKTPSKHLLRDDIFGVVVQHLSREGKIIIAGSINTTLNETKNGDKKDKEDEKKEEKKVEKKEEKKVEKKEEKKVEKKEEDAFTVSGISLRDLRQKNHDLYRQTGDDVITFFEEGLIKPIPCMVAGFHKVNTAMKFMSDMKSCGKVLIDMKNKEADAKTT